jgi:hypothetical protein
VFRMPPVFGAIVVPRFCRRLGHMRLYGSDRVGYARCLRFIQ